MAKRKAIAVIIGGLLMLTCAASAIAVQDEWLEPPERRIARFEDYFEREKVVRIFLMDFGHERDELARYYGVFEKMRAYDRATFDRSEYPDSNAANAAWNAMGL